MICHLVLRAPGNTQIPHFEPLIGFQSEQDADEFIEMRQKLTTDQFVKIRVAFITTEESEDKTS